MGDRRVDYHEGPPDVPKLYRDMGDGWYAVVRAIDDSGMAAVRRGTDIGRWINDKVPGASETVLTDGPAGDQPGIYYNLAEGETVYITQFVYGITTVSDDCAFELGFTDAVNGGGTFQPFTPHRHVFTPAARSGFQDADIQISPPRRVAYADGARSITFRVDANDAACEITCGWHGFRESTPS